MASFVFRARTQDEIRSQVCEKGGGEIALLAFSCRRVFTRLQLTRGD